MQLTLLVALGVASLGRSVSAVPNPAPAKDCTKTITSTRSIKKTPTVTSTSTAVSTRTVTDSPTTFTDFSSTIVGTSTFTSTVSTDTTVTSTSTVTVGGDGSFSTTVATSSGFLPVQSSFPYGTCDSYCGVNPQKRWLDFEEDQNKEDQILEKRACKTTLIIHTRVTSTAPPTTKTSTTTSTTTTTVTPKTTITTATDVNARTTTTVTSFTNTVTTSTTTTVTTGTGTGGGVPAGATAYAACDADNFIDYVQQDGDIVGYLGSFNTKYTLGKVTYHNISSAYDCCVQGFTDGTNNLYSVFQYFPGPDSSPGFPDPQDCLLYTVKAGTPTGQKVGYAIEGPFGDGRPRTVAGNLYYGQINTVSEPS